MHAYADEAIRCLLGDLGALLLGLGLTGRHDPRAGGRSAAPGADGKSAVTYTKDVAPILYQHCLACHRKGQVAPFGMETYEQVRKRASDISTVVEDRTMPPWKAARHFGVKLRNDRSLSDAEIATIQKWADSDAPEGNPADLPPAPKFPEGWTLGTPDLVVDIGTDFQVPAAGEDIYRCFVIPTDLPQDVYVSGTVYRPGNPRVVHHILSYVDTTGEARQKDAADQTPGYFARKPVKRTVHRAGAWNPALVLDPKRPDASHIEVKASWTVPVDVIAFGCAPHMHLLGHDMTMSLLVSGRAPAGPGSRRRLGLQLAACVPFSNTDDLAQGHGSGCRRAF